MRASKTRLLHREKFFCARKRHVADGFSLPRAPGDRTTSIFRPIEWLPQGKVRFLDQTLLPQEEVWVETADYRVVAEAIRRLQVRGAPLIGIAAAYGLALALLENPESAEQAALELRSTRPTAVNLGWALDRCLDVASSAEAAAIAERLIEEAKCIHDEDIAGNVRMGEYGARLLDDRVSVLTHCNAGALATGGFGTALGVIFAAHAEGKIAHVYSAETRPLLQGARLTSWELQKAGIPHTLIADSAAGSLMRRGLIDAVIVGADRITAIGDVANKIGTYTHAVVAKENGVPFYVAAPFSTVDFLLEIGEEIPIEERSPDEVTSFRSERTAPDGTSAGNPAFDVTPNEYVTAIITDNGVAERPFSESLRQLALSEVGSSG